MTAVICPLKNIFSEQPNLAWDILQCQANLQVFPSVDGRQIANLLGHYMRAVEILNSVQDRREEYFKVKMSNLMLRPTVVKSINREDFKARTHRHQHENPETEEVQRTNIVDLQSRREQMAVQLAYHNDRNSKEELTRMMCVEYNRSDKLKDKINQILKNNDKKIMERIRGRKMRAMERREEKYRMEGSCESDDEMTTIQQVSIDSPFKRKSIVRPGSNIVYCQDTEI